MESIIIIIILTIINGYFACVEMAIISANKHKLNVQASEGNKGAKTVLKVLEEPTQFLSTIQVAITLAGFFSSAFAATGLADEMQVIFQNYNLPYNSSVATVIITLILSYITLVFGELVPKRIAIKYANGISVKCIGSVVLISKITKLFVILLTVSTKGILALLQIKDDEEKDMITREEVRHMLVSSKETGAIDEYERELIESVFEFDETLAHEIMVPRNDVVCIDIDKPITAYLESLLSKRHTRIPVYKDNLDKIIGILHTKDLMYSAYLNGFDNIDVENIMEEPYFIPENKNIDDLIRELQENRKHIALLIDEYGGFSGIVTMEDLVEEIVGPIDEAKDEIKTRIEQIETGKYRLYGLVTLDEVAEQCDIIFDDEDCNTISGLLVKYLGKIPSGNEGKVYVNNFVFTIEKVVNKRVEQCTIEIQKDTSH